MSKINETIVMMAEQKETFEVNGKKFQIIEVKEAEEQPDYSHLVGKWLKFVSLSERGFTKDKWYLVDKVDDSDGELMFTDDEGWKNGFFKGQTKTFFDLLNPSDTNPEEKKKILVPSEIRIGRLGNTLTILFGDNQNLFVIKNEKSYWVGGGVVNTIKCELVKCERAELKKGDLAFRSDKESPDFDVLSNYCVVINKSGHAYVNEDKSIYCVETRWKHWYKLQPITE